MPYFWSEACVMILHQLIEPPRHLGQRPETGRRQAGGGQGASESHGAPIDNRRSQEAAPVWVSQTVGRVGRMQCADRRDWVNPSGLGLWYCVRFAAVIGLIVR